MLEGHPCTPTALRSLRRGRGPSRRRRLMPRRVWIFSIACALTLIADQLSKIWARGALVYGRSVPFLGSVWDWELSFNTGSAFGLFQSMGGARMLLTVIGIGACVAILFILRKTADDRGWIASA